MTTGARELTFPMRIKIMAMRPTNIEAAYGSWFAPRCFDEKGKRLLIQVSFCNYAPRSKDDPYWISRKKQFGTMVELSSINKVSLAQVFSCSNTALITDDLYWNSMKDSLELVELSIVYKVILV